MQIADPLLFKNGNTTSFQLLSYAGSLQFLLELGNSIVYRELIGAGKEVLIGSCRYWFSVSRGCLDGNKGLFLHQPLMTTLLWATYSSLTVDGRQHRRSTLARWTLAMCLRRF